MADSNALARFDSPSSAEGNANRIGLIGCSAPHRELIYLLHKVAKTQAAVLIAGPTGTGKELYARFLHECSPRNKKPFVAVNCGAFPDALFENELFGHSIGAFTGARAKSAGLVESAEGGTLFLDEVDALPLAAQIKLLRLIQEKEYRRLGETHVRQADVRFVAATNHDLPMRVKEGHFRQDLFYRIRVVQANVEPLCRRTDDVKLLVCAFIDRFSEMYGLPRVVLNELAWECLQTYHWPGNIRELENCIHSLICRQISRTVEPGDLMLSEIDSLPKERGQVLSVDLLSKGLREAKNVAVSELEVAYLRTALRFTQGNIAKAAKIARKHRRAFFELLRKYQIEAADYRIAPE